MKIVVNHLTRMQSGYFCAAGVDIKTRQHVRPIPARGHLRGRYLASEGGPFDIGAILEIGETRAAPDPPHVEDVEFDLEHVQSQGILAGPRFWNMLTQLALPTLAEIFGTALEPRGKNSHAVAVGTGRVSLGCLPLSAPPDLYLRPRERGHAQVRLRFTNGCVEADAGVTDLRLYGPDRMTPDVNRIGKIAARAAAGEPMFVCLGLTRPYAPKAEDAPLHWLQVNNIHFNDECVWRLGDMAKERP